MKYFLLALLVAVFPFAVQAQVPGSGVSSFGIITPGDCTSWKASGVVMDSGAPCGGGGGIPAPGPSTLGGLFSHSVVSHLFLTGIGLDGTVSAAQPAATDISGLGTAATQSTGTSGTTIPLLSGANTWSAAQTFSAQVAPATNNTTSLGTSALIWSNVFAGVGTFSAASAGTLTGTTSVIAGASSNGITISQATINRNTAAGSLAINAGVGTSTVLGLTAGGSVAITAPLTTVSGALNAGGIVTTSGLNLAKLAAAPTTAPGAGFVNVFAIAGTTSGTCKLMAQAGTSTTATLILDNIGGGC